MAGGIGVDTSGPGGLGLGSSKVVMDPIGLAKVLTGPDGEVVRFMIKLGERVKDKAKAEVGVNTGNLRDHIVKRIVMQSDGVHVHVVADVPYAIYHHEGSRAVNGKLMVFGTARAARRDDAGRYIKGSAVKGTKVFTYKRKAIPPNRFLIRALNSARSLV
jgi:hypothetical protein